MGRYRDFSFLGVVSQGLCIGAMLSLAKTFEHALSLTKSEPRSRAIHRRSRVSPRVGEAFHFAVAS